MNRVEGANQCFKKLTAVGLLISSLFGLSGCSPGEVNCLAGPMSGVKDYPNVPVGKTIVVQGVPFTIDNGAIQLGLNKKNQWNLTVQKLAGKIEITATLQSAINKLPSADQDLRVEQQCLQ
jgi:hypothetical protein